MPSDRERFWGILCLIVVGVGVATRIYNVVTVPPFWDFDSQGHSLNTFALYQGRLPDLRSWSGAHPPLFHGLAAVLWRVAPEAVPVHVCMRIVSLVAGMAMLATVWRTLLRMVPAADAAVATTLLFGVPVVGVVMSMGVNETLCALFTTLALAQLVSSPRRWSVRHAAGVGALGGLAALSKLTGLLAVVTCALVYALAPGTSAIQRGRRVAALLIVAGLVFMPHAMRLVAGADSEAFALSGARSPDMRLLMEVQPPGVRHLTDYLVVPRETFTNPTVRVPELRDSVTALVYANFWSDAHGRWIREDGRLVDLARSVLAYAGLLPLLLAALGVGRIVRSQRARRQGLPVLVHGTLLAGALIVLSWIHPQYTWVRASYLLSGLLFAGLLIASGLALWSAPWRSWLRGFLLVISLAGITFTWAGWWKTGTPATARIGGSLANGSSCRSALHPEGVVCRYLRDLGPDPVRVLALLDPSFHRTHGLRFNQLVAAVAGREVSAAERRDPALELVRARLGWLVALEFPWVRESLAGAEIVGEPAGRDAEGRARVPVRVSAGGAPPFLLNFVLQQRGDGAWRVSAIESRNVVAGNVIAAFSAAPSMEGAQQLMRAARRAVPR